MMRKQETGLKRVWIGIRAFWIGFIIYPIAAIAIFFESIFDGYIFKQIKKKLRK